VNNKFFIKNKETLRA